MGLKSLSVAVFFWVKHRCLLTQLGQAEASQALHVSGVERNLYVAHLPRLRQTHTVFGQAVVCCNNLEWLNLPSPRKIKVSGTVVDLSSLGHGHVGVLSQSLPGLINFELLGVERPAQPLDKFSPTGVSSSGKHLEHVFISP